MEEHLNQAQHNERFLEAIALAFPDDFYDWRVTLVFYTALHYLQATAYLHRKDIGNYHEEIKKNIKQGGNMPLKPWAVKEYEKLEHFSREARYDAFADIETFNITQKDNYAIAQSKLASFKKYLKEEKGLPIA
jgi:hypothetical protein